MKLFLLFIVAFTLFEFLKYQLFVFKDSSIGKIYVLTPAHAGVDAIFVFLMVGIYLYYYKKNKAGSTKESSNNFTIHNRKFFLVCRFIPIISFLLLAFRLFNFLDSIHFVLLPTHLLALSPFFLGLLIFPLYLVFALRGSVTLLKKINPKTFRSVIHILIFCWISSIVNFLDPFTFIFFTTSLFVSVRLLTSFNNLSKDTLYPSLNNDDLR